MQGTLFVLLGGAIIVGLCTTTTTGSAYTQRSRNGPKRAASSSVLIKVPHTVADEAALIGSESIRNRYSERLSANDVDQAYSMVSTDPHHVGYIADNRLYYHRIPHERLVLRYQDIRSINGLRPHLLESIRPFFPFYVDY